MNRVYIVIVFVLALNCLFGLLCDWKTRPRVPADTFRVSKVLSIKPLSDGSIALYSRAPFGMWRFGSTPTDGVFWTEHKWQLIWRGRARQIYAPSWR